jgi:hypothetical protein
MFTASDSIHVDWVVTRSTWKEISEFVFSLLETRRAYCFLAQPSAKPNAALGKKISEFSLRKIKDN